MLNIIKIDPFHVTLLTFVPVLQLQYSSVSNINALITYNIHHVIKKVNYFTAQAISSSLSTALT
jgi:hypothetical protein